jgi:hypothetical protein
MVCQKTHVMHGVFQILKNIGMRVIHMPLKFKLKLPKIKPDEEK